MYSNIIIDVFNLYHRVKGVQNLKESNVISLANNTIDYIENNLVKLQDRDKSMYLLFDPIPKKDFGLDSAFRYSTRRQKVLPDYKINRKFNYCEGDLEAINLVRRYFSHRGKKYIEVYSECYEADDFVESLVKKIIETDKKANIALVTTDNDWARYLGKQVVMLNESPSKPYTSDDFIKEYNFIPTVTSVTFFKALFGDPADNITGALMQKRLKKLDHIKLEGFEFIKEIATSTDKIDDILERTTHYRLSQISEKNEKYPAEKHFFFSIISSDFKELFDSLYIPNVKTIRSQCKDYEKYAAWKEPEEKFNNFIEEVLKRKIPKAPAFKFGKIKV